MLFNAGFILALALLAVIGLNSYQNSQRATEYDNWVIHSNTVIRRLDQLLSSLDDAERVQRGFIITRNNDYLRTYDEDTTKVASRFAELKQLTIDNLSQQQNLDSVDQLISNRLALLTKTIELVKINRTEAVTKILNSNRGKEIMDSIRMIVARAETEENNLLRERSNLKNAYTSRLDMLLVTGGILSIFILTLIFIFLKREIRTRKIVEQQLRIHQENLTELIDERTKELNASKEQWVTTLQSIGDAVIATDERGIITFMNFEAEFLTGWSKKEAIGLPSDRVFRIINEKTRLAVESPVDKVINEGLMVGLANHTILISREGREIPIDNSGAPIRSEGGRATGVVLIFRDISDRKRAEDALRESEQKYRNIIETANEGIWISDINARITFVNKKMADMLGYSPGEIIGKSAFEFMDEEAREISKKNIERRLKGFTDSYQLKYIRKDGSTLWVTTNASPILNVKGKVTAFMGLYTDITAQKQALEKLEQSEENYRNIVETATEGIWIGNTNGITIYINKRMSEMLGYPPEEVIGKEWFDFMDEEAIAVSRANIEQRKKGIKNTYEQKYIRKDGTILWTLVSATPLRDKQGQVTSTMGMLADITERKKAEEELKKSEERFRSTLDHMMEGAQIVGFDWRFIYINDVADEHNRRPKEELLGKRYMDIWPGIESTPIFELIRDCMENRVFHAVENEFTFPDGNKGWFDLRIEPIPEGIFILSVDITERKKAEELLKESEERFTKAFRNNPAALSITRLADGLFVEVNEGFTQLFGYEPEELIGRKSTDLNLFMNAEERKEIVHRLQERGNLRNYEIIARNKNGRPLTVLFSAEKINFKGEEHILYTTIDVTDRKKMEEALRESERRWATTLSSIGDAVISTDNAGNVTFLNPGAEFLTGWKLNEAVGQPIKEIFNIVNEETRKEVESPVDKVIREGTVVGLANHTILIGKDGKETPIDDSGAPIRTENGETTGVVLVFRDISERKKTERIAGHLSALVNSSDEAIISKDLEGKILTWNTGAEKIYGYSAEEAIGRDISFLVPPGDTNDAADIIKRIRRDKQIATYEARRMRKDGSIINVSVTYSPIKDSAGKIVGISKISHDITDRKKAEAALRESEERFKQLANAMTQLAWIANADGYIFWYNDRWYDYSGTTPEQMEGWGWQSVHDPEALPDVMKKWKASIETGAPFEMIFPLRGKDGIYRDFLTRGIPIRDEEGKVHQWFGTNTDVSVLRKAELDLKHAQEKLNLVLDNGHVGVWERDLKNNRLIFDKRMDRMFGLEEGTFEGTYEAFEKCLVAEDLPHVREAVRKALNEKIPIDTIYRVKLPDGKVNHINSKGFVIEEEEGQPVRLAGVCFDITEMREGAEEALFKLNEELLRSNKELEQFAFVASHDLQEPLRTISTFTNLLAQRYKEKLDGDARQFLHYTVEGASRMQVLINDLLSYSRIATRGQEFSEVDLNKILKATLGNLKIRIEEKNALITSDKLPVIYGDEGQLGQLVQNLVGNALKFCTTMPRIHVSARKETDHYLFSVKDNGIGIEAQYSDKIFLIFQRLVNKEEFEGSGIGLAICKRVVERHGGKIFFESKPGEGTTFYFTIPKKPNI